MDRMGKGPETNKKTKGGGAHITTIAPIFRLNALDLSNQFLLSVIAKSIISFRKVYNRALSEIEAGILDIVLVDFAKGRAKPRDPAILFCRYLDNQLGHSTEIGIDDSNIVQRRAYPGTKKGIPVALEMNMSPHLLGRKDPNIINIRPAPSEKQRTIKTLVHRTIKNLSVEERRIFCAYLDQKLTVYELAKVFQKPASTVAAELTEAFCKLNKPTPLSTRKQTASKISRTGDQCNNGNSTKLLAAASTIISFTWTLCRQEYKKLITQHTKNR